MTRPIAYVLLFATIGGSAYMLKHSICLWAAWFLALQAGRLMQALADYNETERRLPSAFTPVKPSDPRENP